MSALTAATRRKIPLGDFAGPSRWQTAGSGRSAASSATRPDVPELTPRQARFCAEFVVDLNGEQAAIRAGYSPRTARSQASRLLTKANVGPEIARLQASRAERTDITADRVLAELAKLGFANMADYMQAGLGGDPYLDFSALSRDQAAALQEVTVDTYVEGHGDEARDVKRIKFKLADKRAALVDIGRHLGMFVQKHEVTGKDGEPLVAPVEPSKIALLLLNMLQAARPPESDRG